jgi:hypothetical protein
LPLACRARDQCINVRPPFAIQFQTNGFWLMAQNVAQKFTDFIMCFFIIVCLASRLRGVLISKRLAVVNRSV